MARRETALGFCLRRQEPHSTTEREDRTSELPASVGPEPGGLAMFIPMAVVVHARDLTCEWPRMVGQTSMNDERARHG